MYYFDYVKDVDASRALSIYEAVNELKGYAMAIYKSLWEDALDKAFFHILDNYDESSGDLEHYATKIVGTILLNKYAHEIEHETSLSNALDQKSLNGDVENNPLDIVTSKEEIERSSDLDRCIEYLIPMFVKDYKFFKTKKASDRKLSYNGLFQKFSERTVASAMISLVDRYGKDMDDLYELCKSCRMRAYPEDRYLKSMDATVEYLGVFNNILLYKCLSRKVKKVFYSFNIRENVTTLIDVFYSSEDAIGKRVIGSLEVYCTLSGKIVTSPDELYDCIERDIVGSMLAKMSHLKVVQYEKGEKLIMSSPKDTACGLVLDVFGKEFSTDINKVVSKRVEGFY